MLSTRYSNEIIKSLEPWWEECEKRIAIYVENKMQKFDGIVLPKVVERIKWGWHPLSHIFTTIPSLWGLAPTFPWMHNNNEVINVCDGICNMERVGIFYPMPWCARFIRLYTFSKRINIPMVHSLHRGTEMNCKQWFSKGLNNR
jgi:hypothetical protein